MAKWLLAMADGGSGNGGGAAPVDVDVGPFAVASTDVDVTICTFALPLTSPGRLTVGVSVNGWQDETPVGGYIADFVFDVLNVNGTWSTLAPIAASREVMSESLQAPSPWQVSLAVVDGSVVVTVVTAAAGGQDSHWQVQAWYRPAIEMLTPVGPPYVASWGVPETSGTAVVDFTSPIVAAGGVPPYRYAVTVDSVIVPPLSAFSEVAPTSANLQTEGPHVVRAYVADSADTISVAAVRNCVVSFLTTYFDSLGTFTGANGDPLPAGYTTPNGAVGEQYEHAFRRTDSGAYRTLGNLCDGAVPADEYFVTFRFPDATIGGFCGWVARWNGVGSGVQVICLGDRLALSFGFAEYLNWDTNNAVVTVTGGYPASWSETTHEHELSFGFPGGARVVVYLDGEEYGYFDAPDTGLGAGTGFAVSGEGSNRVFTRFRVTNLLPEFVP